MPWPPTVPPATRTNSTAELDAHPSDHNQTSAALSTLVARATNAPGGLFVSTAAFSGSAGSAGLVVATLNVAAKAGRRYLLGGQVTGHNATANANMGAQIKDGSTILYDLITTGTVANGYLTLPISAFLDGGAADRTAVVTVLAYGQTGIYVIDRGLLWALDIGPTAPVAVP